MIVYVPHPKNPLYGSWWEVDHRPRVKPSVVRVIYRARLGPKLEAGLAPEDARPWAAEDTAHMLGLTLRTVRVFCGLEKGQRRKARKTSVARDTPPVPAGGQG